MQKLGMKVVTGVSRVTVKKSKNVGLRLLVLCFDAVFFVTFLFDISNFCSIFRYSLSSPSQMSSRALLLTPT
jgi:hypothetical protein